MPPAIVVDNVSKQFLIGRARYSSLRDHLARAWRRLRRRPPESDTERRREFWALKDVSFDVEPGTTLGIIGPNGAGKSTLLKLISRVSSPTRGCITTHGRVSALIEVGAGFHPELTGRENVYLNGSILGMTRKEIAGKFDEIVDFSGLEQFIDTPVKYYSSGMYARLGFSVAAHVAPDILLVDEVLSVGDWGFQEKCLERMQGIVSAGATVVLVSHNVRTVAGLCTRVVVLHDGKTVHEGDATAGISKYHDLLNQNRVDSEGHVRLQQNSAVSGLVCHVLDEDGNNATHLRSGAGYAIEVGFTPARRITNPYVDIALYSDQGQFIYGLSNRFEERHLPDFVAGRCVNASVIGQANVLSGSYRVSVKVGQWDSVRPICHVERAATVFVDGDHTRRGIADMNGSLSVSQE